jgi:hypothetical protein
MTGPEPRSRTVAPCNHFAVMVMAAEVTAVVTSTASEQIHCLCSMLRLYFGATDLALGTRSSPGQFLSTNVVQFPSRVGRSLPSYHIMWPSHVPMSAAHVSSWHHSHSV